jgi:chromosomal replication initiation ATPase DnaA
MARAEGPSRRTDGAALLAQYRASRARLMGPSRAPVVSVSAPPRRSRRRAVGAPRWLAELIAFNEELRRLFLRARTRGALQSGERIRDAVAEHYGITFAEIVGDSALRRCAWPRQVAMYICARHAGLSSPHIGRLFGDRDPKTIRFAVRAIEARMEKDPALATAIPALIETCGLGGPA